MQFFNASKESMVQLRLEAIAVQGHDSLQLHRLCVHFQDTVKASALHDEKEYKHRQLFGVFEESYLKSQQLWLKTLPRL